MSRRDTHLYTVRLLTVGDRSNPRLNAVFTWQTFRRLATHPVPAYILKSGISSQHYVLLYTDKSVHCIHTKVSLLVSAVQCCQLRVIYTTRNGRRLIQKLLTDVPLSLDNDKRR